MHKTYFKDKKQMSSQQVRSTWIKLCLCLWGMIIVKRDVKCQWCGGTRGLTGHHIVTRGSTKGNKLSWFLLENGVGLCLSCHGTAHGRGRQRTLHDYMEWEGEYLKERDMSYKLMKRDYSVIAKMTKHDIQLQFNILRAKCEGMRIPYTENKTYIRLTKKLAGV